MDESTPCKKLVAVALLYPLTFPLASFAILHALIFRSYGVFDAASKLLSLVPGKFGECVRAAYYFQTLSRCSYDVAVGFGSFFSDPRSTIGRQASIGDYCVIDSRTDIGDGARIHSRVSILPPARRYRGWRGWAKPRDAVTIGARSVIGEGAIVMADVVEGDVVAPGQVVAAPVWNEGVLSGIAPLRDAQRNRQAALL